jgi:hypothetical protein
MDEYTNRELGILIEKLSEKIDDGFKGVHDRQDKTNGHVSDNVTNISSLQNWRWYIIGCGSAVLFVIGLVLKLK